MAQPTKSGLSVEDLKKSLKSLSSEMNPEQLKRANETLGKLESVSAKPNDDSVEIQKTNIKIEKSLDKTGPINESLKELLKLYKTSHKESLKHNKQLLKKLDDSQKPKDRMRLGDIKYEKPLTFKEDLKENVAGVKNLFSKAKGIGSGIASAFSNPLQTVKKGISKAQDKFYKGVDFVSDVASTDKNYTAEGGRFGETYAKTDEGKKFGDKAQKMGEVAFNQLKAKEKEIGSTESNIKEMESQGFDANKTDKDKLKLLKKERVDLDIRNPSLAPVSKKQKAASSTAEGPSEKANEAAEKSSVEALTKARSENPEADNTTSANEKMADSLKELSQTSKDLLTTTKESVDILKAIKADLAGDDVKPLRGKPAEGSGSGAPAAAEAAPASPSLLDTALDIGGDLLDSGKGKGKGPGKGFPRGKAPSIPGKGGLGSNILIGIN